MSQQYTEIPQSSSMPSTVTHWQEFATKPQLLIILGLVAAYYISKLMTGEPKGKGARFATKQERDRSRKIAMKQIQNKANEPTEVGVVLDNTEREGLAYLQTSTIVMGSVKTGKTKFGINPIVKGHIDRGDPIVLFDYKYPGQTKDLIGYATSQGYKEEDIHIFAPTFPESCTFNLTEHATNDYATTLADVLIKNLTRDQGKQDPFFGPAGVALVTAVMQLARQINGNVITCQAILSLDRLADRIRLAKELIDPWAYQAFATFLSTGGSAKTQSSIQTTAALNFDKFLRPNLIGSFTGESNLPLKLEGRKIVVLGCNYKYRSSILPIIASVLQLIIDNNVYLGRKTPLPIVLDEFPTLYLPSIVEQIAAIRSYGVFFYLGVQNRSQIELTYGKDKVNPILGNCRNKICYNPGEPESAKWISDMVGQTQIIERDRSRSYNPKGQLTRNLSKKRDWRPLLPPEEIQEFGFGRRVVFTEGVGNQRKGFIPYITQSAPSKQCEAAFTLSKKRWPSLLQRMQDRTDQNIVTPEHISQQRHMVEYLFPLPTPESDTGFDELLEASFGN